MVCWLFSKNIRPHFSSEKKNCPWYLGCFFLKTTFLCTVAANWPMCRYCTLWKIIGDLKSKLSVHRCLSQKTFRDLSYETKILTEIKVQICIESVHFHWTSVPFHTDSCDHHLVLPGSLTPLKKITSQKASSLLTIIFGGLCWTSALYILVVVHQKKRWSGSSKKVARLSSFSMTTGGWSFSLSNSSDKVK